MHAGAVKASRELGAPMVWKGPLKEDDRDEQIKIVENFTNMGVRGIVLAPLDDSALRTPVADATRRRIPVVIIDSALAGDEQVSFVATDNEKGGQLAGEHLAKLLGGEGEVAILRYQEGSASTTARERGFLAAMAAYDGIRIASANQFAGATTESAVKASENILAAHRGGAGTTLRGIFCPSESTTFGMLLALRQAGLAGKVKLVGFDSSKNLVEALRSGDIAALVLQDPMGMGYLGVKTMVDHLAGKPAAKRVDTALVLATKENLAEPRVKELLEPDFARWLEKN